MKKFWSEFKAFISKGNVLDLAVAVIIGGAFNKIVSSLVNDVIMPLISLAIGGADVSEWKWVIKAATDTTPETALRYGIFIQAIIDFLIIAFTIFLIVKIFNFSKNKLKQMGEEVALQAKKHKKHKKGKGAEVAADQAIELAPETQEAKVDEKVEEAKADVVEDAKAEVAEDTKAEVAEDAKEEEKPNQEQLLAEIRDLLKASLNKTEE